MKYEKALQATAHVGQTADPVQNLIHILLANGIVSTCVVVGGILLPSDHLLRMEELPVGSCTDLICNQWPFIIGKLWPAKQDSSCILTHNSGLKVDKDSSWHMLASASLTKEGVERVVRLPHALVRWHLAIRLDAMLQAVQLPACIAHLDSGLADMDRDTLALQQEKISSPNLTMK